jgi:hypothetical protein
MNFITKNNKGLDLIMKNKVDKRLSMTYNINNFKLKLMLAIKKEKANIKETAKELKEKVV